MAKHNRGWGLWAPVSRGSAGATAARRTAGRVTTRRRLPAAAVLFLAVGAPAAGRADATAPCSPSPVIDSDFPDPDVFLDPAPGGAALVYGTNIMTADGRRLNIPMIRSRDPSLALWTPPEDALPRLPAWARADYTWAPALAVRPGGPYRLYFTARYGFSGRPCIGVAVSQNPEGPFAPVSETRPLACPLSQGGAIDPSVFQDDDGTEYLLWKTDSNCCDGEPAIDMEALAPDGLSLAETAGGDAPWLLPGARTLIGRDRPWEGRVVEAPVLRKHDGRYTLFYSAGSYLSSAYAVGYAVSTALFGPYVKAQEPILSASSANLEGPGGEDVFTGPDQTTWLAFHAWRTRGAQRYRALFFGRITWTPDGPAATLPCPAPQTAPALEAGGP